MVPSVGIVAFDVEVVAERLGICSGGIDGCLLAGLVVPLVHDGAVGTARELVEDVGQGLGVTVGETVAEVVPDVDGEGTAGDDDTLTVHEVTGSTQILGIGCIPAVAVVDVDKTAVEVVVLGGGSAHGLGT